MIGGASRLPKVRAILAQQGIPLAYHLNPDESVAWGAAEYARLLVSDLVVLVDAQVPGPFVDQLRELRAEGVAQLEGYIANEAKREEQKRRRILARAALESELLEAREEGLADDEALKGVSDWLDEAAPTVALEEFETRRAVVAQLRNERRKKDEL